MLYLKKKKKKIIEKVLETERHKSFPKRKFFSRRSAFEMKWLERVMLTW